MSRSPVTVRSGRTRLHRLGGLSLLAGALLLGGCAGAIRLENDVRSYADWSAGAAGESTRPAPGDRYRFERRPSQLQSPSLQQEALEELARQALERVGLRAASSSAAHSVGLSAQGPSCEAWVSYTTRALRASRSTSETSRW